MPLYCSHRTGKVAHLHGGAGGGQGDCAGIGGADWRGSRGGIGAGGDPGHRHSCRTAVCWMGRRGIVAGHYPGGFRWGAGPVASDRGCGGRRIEGCAGCGVSMRANSFGRGTRFDSCPEIGIISTNRSVGGRHGRGYGPRACRVMACAVPACAGDQRHRARFARSGDSWFCRRGGGRSSRRVDANASQKALVDSASFAAWNEFQSRGSAPGGGGGATHKFQFLRIVMFQPQAWSL